jgi:hypothetical protein
MCFKSGSSSPRQVGYQASDGSVFLSDPGIPQEYVDRGARTNAQWQMMAQQDASDTQLAQQRQIAADQDAFNQKQLADQKAAQDKLQQQADEQAARQTSYDTGRAQLLSEGSKQIDDAFAKFSPDYFKQYTKDYMTKATDDINYQKGLAQKQLAFGLARQGLGSSSTAADQAGLLEEDSGRATAAQTANATDATNSLMGNVSGAKKNLLGQVIASESVGPPVAGVNDQAVSVGLDTKRQAISGVTNTAGDTISSLGGVPTVSPLTNIFANVLGGVGSYVGGNAAANTGYAYNRGYSAAANPPGTSSGGFK